jgi:hypothetical protein
MNRPSTPNRKNALVLMDKPAFGVFTGLPGGRDHKLSKARNWTKSAICGSLQSRKAVTAMVTTSA